QPVGHGDHRQVGHAGQAGADHGVGEAGGLAAQVAAGVGHILAAGGLLPALGGDVVVGAGVDHAVGGVGVGQVSARLPAVEGELHDLHARAAAGGQQGFHLVGQVAQVLGDARIPSYRLVHGVQKRLARAFDPLAALGGG